MKTVGVHELKNRPSDTSGAWLVQRDRDAHRRLRTARRIAL